MGRSAAVLAISSAASVTLTFGPGLAAAHALDDKDNHRCDDKKDGWGIFGDKDDRDDKDRDRDDKIDGDKQVRADRIDDGLDGRNGLDGKDDRDGRNGLDGKDDRDGRNGLDGKDDRDGKDGKDNWFRWDDKKRDCVVGGVGGVGAGVGPGGGPGGGPGAGVAAGGGGMADPGSSPLLPLAGAAVGALLIGAGVARRRAQGAS
ncbi:hypothetical protein [Frankia sp. CcWB2]